MLASVGRVAGAALFASLTAAVASAAPPPSVRLGSAPGSVTAGGVWRAVVLTVGPGVPIVTARLEDATVRAATARIGRHRFRVSVRLGDPGTWRVDAILGRRRFALGRVAVRPRQAPEYALDNPAQLLVLPDGSLLVTERGQHNRVLEVEPGSGAFHVFATGIPAPWGLARAPDGTIVVSSASGLYRVREGEPPERFTRTNASPLAMLPNGDIAFANETFVGVIRPGSSGAPRTFEVDVSIPHGLAVLPDGAIAVSDTAHGRIVRVDPVTGAWRVLAGGLLDVVGLAAEPSGSLLAAEFRTGRLLRIGPAGDVAVVATGLRKPYGLARAPDGSVYVTEAGDVTRASGALRRVGADGRISPVHLVAE